MATVAAVAFLWLSGFRRTMGHRVDELYVEGHRKSGQPALSTAVFLGARVGFCA
jgi:hypothetical protein